MTLKPDSSQNAAPSVSANLTERDKKFRERSLNDTMWRVVLSVGAPLALYQSLQQIFSILDTMMASHISAESVSAVAYLGQLGSILSALGGGLAVGAGIMISQAYGMGDYKLVKKRVSTLYALSLLIGLLILLAILPFVVPFLRFAKTPEELIRVGGSYFSVQLLVMVVSFLNNVYICVERARGNSGRILYLNMIVLVTKLGLTALFVYVLGGGLIMIAAASLLSQLALLFFSLRNSLEKDNAFGFAARAVSMERHVVAPMMVQSLPIMTEKALFSYGKTIVNSMSTIYGALMVGALGVSNNLGGITTNPQNGFQDGTAAIISQNLGACRPKRVLSAFYSCCLINGLLGAAISGLELANLSFLSSLFAGGNDAFREMIELTYRYEALAAVPLGINAAILALFYGLGKTRLTLIVNFFRVFVFRIPVFFFLQRYTSLGNAGSGMVMLISNLATALLSAVMAYFVIRRFKKERLASPDS